MVTTYIEDFVFKLTHSKEEIFNFELEQLVDGQVLYAYGVVGGFFKDDPVASKLVSLDCKIWSIGWKEVPKIVIRGYEYNFQDFMRYAYKLGYRFIEDKVGVSIYIPQEKASRLYQKACTYHIMDEIGFDNRCFMPENGYFAEVEVEGNIILEKANSKNLKNSEFIYLSQGCKHYIEDI
ncbi:MAG TPA: hypothetical protein DCL21_04980, partial [Alphaproteobacteria bacterium]|nr:hypothetical protein [Alphaproteobacteria bacterium]